MARAPEDEKSDRILKALLEAGGEASVEDLAEATDLKNGVVLYRVNFMDGGHVRDTERVLETPLLDTHRADPDRWVAVRPRIVEFTEAGEEHVADLEDVVVAEGGA